MTYATRFQIGLLFDHSLPGHLRQYEEDQALIKLARGLLACGAIVRSEPFDYEDRYHGATRVSFDIRVLTHNALNPQSTPVTVGLA